MGITSPSVVGLNSSSFPFLHDVNVSLHHLYDYEQNASLTVYLPRDGVNISTSTLSEINNNNYAAGYYYQRFVDESRHWVQRVLVPLVMCVGVVCNSVSMVVLTRRKMRSSTNSYLTALAISDLMYLVSVFSLSLQHHPNMKQLHHWFYWEYFRYALWLTDASSSTSIWLTVTFTIERYIAISHPFKGKVVCTVSRAKKVVCVVYLLCFVLTATTPHEWVVVTKHTPFTNQSYLTIDYSSLGQDSTYRHTYYWFTAVTFIILPLCLLAVFNFILIQAVRMNKLTRRKMTRVSTRDHYSHQQEYKITLMLIAVVILALVCQMPTAVLLLYSTVYEPPPNTKAYAVMRGLGNIFNLLNAINAAANFILYCSFSDKYRKTFLVTFRPCMYHHHHHYQPSHHTFVASNDSPRRPPPPAPPPPGAGRPSVRSVARRKASSLPPSLPSSHHTSVHTCHTRGNGVTSLDRRITLQCGSGQPSHQLFSSPGHHHHHHHHLINTVSHTADINSTNHDSPHQYSSEGVSSPIVLLSHPQGPAAVEVVTCRDDLEMRPRRANDSSKLLNGSEDEKDTSTHVGGDDSSSLNSVSHSQQNNSLLELRYIDDVNCDTGQCSPPSPPSHTHVTRNREEGTW